MKKSQKTVFEKLLFPGFVFGLVLVMVINLISPPRYFSWIENRNLSLKVEGLPGQEGYVDEREQMTSDQFFGRTTLMHLNYLLRKSIGQKEMKSVYLCQDCLMMVPEKHSETFDNNINYIWSFLESANLPGTVMVVPSAAWVKQDKLSGFATVEDQQAVWNTVMARANENFRVADPYSILKEHADEDLFYKTDHHWTSKGAGYGAQAFLNATGKEFNPDSYALEPVCDNFEGTLAAKTGSVFLKDTIEVAVPSTVPEYTVSREGSANQTSIYDLNALKQKDKYELFLGRNEALVHIETDSDSEASLLLIKDSYANSMIQYLLPYYSSITVVDPRFYFGDLNNLMELYGINECGVVFSWDIFNTQSSIVPLLQSYDQLVQE